MNLQQIGVIHSPFKTRAEAPFQGRHSEEVCEVEVFEEFLPGLSDVEGCTHLILLYWLDRADRNMLKAFPPYDGKEHGVFATRSPNRPNPIGVGIVELRGVEGGRLKVRGLDAMEGSPPPWPSSSSAPGPGSRRRSASSPRPPFTYSSRPWPGGEKGGDSGAPETGA